MRVIKRTDIYPANRRLRKKRNEIKVKEKPKQHTERKKENETEKECETWKERRKECKT